MINQGLINGHPVNANAGNIEREDVAETAVITNPEPVQVAFVTAVQDVTETAVVTSAMYLGGSDISANVTETALITSSLATGRLNDLAETAVITNPEPVQVLSDHVIDTAVIADTAYAGNTTDEDVTETAVITSTSTQSIITDVDVLEAAVITSAVYLSTAHDDIVDSAVITSATTTSISAVLDVAETAVITSNVDTGQGEDVAETAVITSAVTASNTSVLDVTETAVITSADVLASNNVLDVYETAVIESIASHRADTVTDILEEGFISSEVYISADADVWTANTINWAMSTYTGLTLTGASGDFAVSDEGLFVKHDSYANMNMSTGHSDLGSGMLKALPYAYIYAEYSSPPTVRVTADANGAKRTEAYMPLARSATKARAVRCTFGRGFRSSYYKLNLVSSGYAQVRECVPVVDDLSRRI